MPRLQLIEIEDQPWCPRTLRDAGTDYLQFSLTALNPYAAIVPKIVAAMERCGTETIVDMCSGGGGPWQRLLPQLALKRPGLQVQLTDLYPNAEAFERMETLFPGRVEGVRERVDATAVGRPGFRTIFSGFHHFPPELAREMLADAVRERQGIGVFEVTDRSPKSIVGILNSWMLVLLTTPLTRPFRWSRLLWTYLLPLLPALVVFDGVVSCLRTYDPSELRALLVDVPDAETYHWEVGKAFSQAGLPVTYLIGTPA